MRKFINERFDYLIPVLVLFFAVFSIWHDVGPGILNYIDHQFPFDFSKLLNNQVYVWNDSIYLGYNQSLGQTMNLSYTALFSFIQSVISNYIIINRIEYILAIFCNIYFTYLFLTSIFSKQLKNLEKIGVLLCSSFFISNILSASLFFGAIPQQIFAFSFIPLSLYGIKKYVLTKKSVICFWWSFLVFFFLVLICPTAFWRSSRSW